MSKLPFWILSHWGFDEDKDKQKILVAVLNYRTYKILKQEHQELKLVYYSTSYNENTNMVADNTSSGHMYNEENFNIFSPDFDISEELSFYLTLIEGKELLD